MKRQRGVILMSALILVALAAVVAATMFHEAAMSARRSAASFSMEQALQLGQGAEALAGYALGEDTNQDDSMSDSWAQPYGPVEVAPEVSLEALVTDEQAKFNLNTLIKPDGERDEDAYRIFRRILELTELERRFADLLVDWIDSDVMPNSEGGEDSLYTSRQPAHLTANLLLTSISELQQMPGFTREMYLKLAPHVTALPPAASKINVCLASGVVLDALYALSDSNPGYVEYSRQTPEELARLRANGCFPRLSVIAANEEKMQDRAAERSSYFRLQTWIRIGTSQFALYSLMYREQRGQGPGQARAITRSFGTE